MRDIFLADLNSNRHIRLWVLQEYQSSYCTLRSRTVSLEDFVFSSLLSYHEESYKLVAMGYFLPKARVVFVSNDNISSDVMTQKEASSESPLRIKPLLHM